MPKSPSADTASTATQSFAELLMNALRPLEDADDIKAAASRVLGQHLQANRVAYFEVTATDYVVERDYTRGVVSLNGRYPVASFGAALLDAYQDGQTAVVADVCQNPDVTAGQLAAFTAINIGAYVGVPLVKAGIFVAGLSVHQAEPRAWTPAEVALVEETAERTWAAVKTAGTLRRLKASERLRRVALEAAGLGVWSVNPSDMALTTDERFRMIFQGSSDALSYEAAVNAVHPDDSARNLAAIEAAMRVHEPLPYKQEYRVTWPDGSLHWVFSTGRGHLLTGPQGQYLEIFDGTIQDITELKRAQIQTRDVEERAGLLFDAMGEGAFIIEMIVDDKGNFADYRFLNVNPAFERLCGLKGAVGKTIRQLVPTIEQHWIDFYGQVALTGKPGTIQQSNQLPDERWWDVTAYQLGGAGSLRVAGLFTDITERKKLELIKAAAEKREHLAASERDRLVAELQEQDQRKDEFLAMLSHELRNPLAPISNAVQLLRLHAGNDARQLQSTGIIERQVGQLKRLVDDLLEVSRITTGRIELRQNRVTLNAIVYSAVETTRPRMQVRRHEVVVNMPEQPIWLMADAARLEQVLVNLLVNAAKYSNDCCRISITAESQEKENGPEAVLRVHDTGFGIAPELLPRVFDLFTQAERSLARSEGGLGIGLALVKRLTELHGGRVEVSSTFGRGSEFVVRLPVAVAEVSGHTVSKARTPSVAPVNLKRRVLVVDDNIDAAETLAELLQLCGHEVRVAHDGLSALQAASEYLPGVVLLDIGLPHMDGFEVAKQIRQQSALKGVVLVALTGYGQASDLKRSVEAGFDFHLTKPADFTQIEKILAGS